MAQTPNAAQSRKDEVTRLESLAQETDTSLNLVKAIYTEELEALEQQARIRTYLTVIAMRRTRLILQDLEVGTESRSSH